MRNTDYAKKKEKSDVTLTVVSRVGSKSPSASRIARLSSSMSIGLCGREDGSSATAERSLENNTLLDYKYCSLHEFQRLHNK